MSEREKALNGNMKRDLKKYKDSGEDEGGSQGAGCNSPKHLP
jgi:hypothetical protein